MRRRFSEFVTDRHLIAEGARVVVGVSGGLDSTVLWHLLRETGFEPVAAHVNYGLRGEASDADEAHVRALADAWGLPIHVRRVDLGGAAVQAAARTARYAFFDEVAREVGAGAVATAHHRDDQAETLLLNLLRGAGPTGLAGIPVRRPLVRDTALTLVRPLLWASRSEIEAYARTHDLRWREDATNAGNDYRRNVLRHEVLPLIRHAFPDASEQMAHAANLLREYLDAGAALAPDALFEEAADLEPQGRGLRLDVLAAQPEVVSHGILLEALRRWVPEAPRSAASLAELASLIDAQPGRRVVWQNVTVWRERDRLTFVTETSDGEYAVTVDPGTTMTPVGTLHVERLDERPSSFDPSPLVEVVDAERLRFPLTLRSWRVGERLQPVGLDGHKRVSDVLTEGRVPPHRRAQHPVLVSGEEIVWVVGHRLAGSFAVGPRTRTVARLTWRPVDSLALDGS